MISVAPGISRADDADLNAAQVVYLVELRAALPSTVPLYVTSGERGPQRQARAMLAKLAQGDDLLKLYPSLANVIRGLLALPRDESSWTAALQALVDRGIYVSRHMRGAAVDLRIRDLSPAQVAQLKAAVTATGGRHLEESIPPHLHVDLPARLVTGQARPAPAKDPGPTVLDAVTKYVLWGLQRMTAPALVPGR